MRSLRRSVLPVLDERIERLYTDIDPDYIAQSVPGVGPVLAPDDPRPVR